MQKLKNDIRDRIEKAAIREFSTKGFKDASIRSIAKEAGVSKSNLYNYFENKEILFNSLCESMSYKLHKLMDRFRSSERNESFNDQNFIEQFIGVLTRGIGEFIQEDRERLLMIFDASTGTKYENMKDDMIHLLEDHFIDSLTEEYRAQMKNPFVMHLIATNLVGSFLEIVRHYKDGPWCESAVENYMHYHIKGIAQFYE